MDGVFNSTRIIIKIGDNFLPSLKMLEKVKFIVKYKIFKCGYVAENTDKMYF